MFHISLLFDKIVLSSLFLCSGCYLYSEIWLGSLQCSCSCEKTNEWAPRNNEKNKKSSIFVKFVKVDGDLVSGTNIAVKSAPTMQSAAYNQKVPENLSGDCTCWQSQRLVYILPIEQNLNCDTGHQRMVKTYQVYEGFGDNEAGNEGKTNYNRICHRSHLKHDFFEGDLN